MMNLHDRLDSIAGPAVAPSAEQADADVARGRRALRRRRTVQQLAGSAFAIAALAAAVTYGTSGTHTPAAPPATQLVAYQGAQPKGFSIDKVPAGWQMQGVDAGVLVIAPVGAANKDMNVFVDKIAVMLQSRDDHSTPAGTAVRVGDKEGVIAVPEGAGGGKNLWVKQPDGVWLEVQIWNATGWTQDKIVEFGAGIHVLPGAVQGRG